MFGVRREQGRLAELAPVDPDPGRRRDARAARGGPGSSPLLAELGMERRGAARARARSPPKGSTRSASRCGSASLTYLTDACAALGDEAMAALVYPELEPLAGANVMIGHLVACYGAADRYLGMLAATLGERGARRGALRARAWS